MSLNNEMLSLVENLSTAYRSKLFSPGSLSVDVENAYYVICMVDNELVRDTRRYSGSCLEIIFDRKRNFVLAGHFLKFAGRRKIKYLTRRIDLEVAQENFYFSEDFNALYISDEESEILIELNFQGRNFYVKNLSLKTSAGNELHDSLILALDSKYLSYAELIKFGARKQISAAKKLLNGVNGARRRGASSYRAYGKAPAEVVSASAT